METEVVSLQDIFVFDRRGVAEDGKVLGQYVSTGIRPKFAERCRLFGVPLKDEYFQGPTEVPVQVGVISYGSWIS